MRIIDNNENLGQLGESSIIMRIIDSNKDLR